CPGSAERELKGKPVEPRKPVSAHRHVPPVVGGAAPTSALKDLTPVDMEMLTMIGRHPFISLSDIGTLLSCEPRVGRWRCGRLIKHDLVRIVGADEIGEAAASNKPLDLTRLGVRVVA